MAMAAASCSLLASKAQRISALYMDSPPSFLPHTRALRITVLWPPNASPFSCTKQTLKPFGCSGRPFLPSVRADSSTVFHGECFVVQDNIDTDQIIPAEHLTLVPSQPDEYEKLGSLALIGLPSSYGRFVEEGQMKTKYSIIIAGANFGCGSSREHAPVALGASGVRAVVAGSYSRIFFRNSVATGELYPIESEELGLSKECKTGDIVTVDLERCILTNHTQKKQYALKALGDAGPVIDAGGLFAFARKTGKGALCPLFFHVVFGWGPNPGQHFPVSNCS